MVKLIKEMETFFGALRADHPGKGLKWVPGFVQSCIWSSRCICAPADMHLHLCLKAIQRICMYAIIFDLQSIASGFWVCCILYITAYIYCKCKCTHPEICKHADLKFHLQPIHWMRSNYPKEHSLKASRLYLKCTRTADFFTTE